MSSAPTEQEATRIAVEGYHYLYPLVTMEVSRRQLTNGAADARPGRGPMGAFHHLRAFPSADFKVVVRPNFDTLYSTAWVDVSDEPVVVTAPATDRYYLLPCYDMWSDAFTVPGTRTTGTGPLAFALARPDWQGTLPEGVLRFDAPTPTVWIIGRVQTNGPADYPAVREFQDQLAITPLSAWPGPAPEPPVVDDPDVDTETPPLDLVNAMSGDDYFSFASDLLARHPAHLTDGSMSARLGRIGFGPGRAFGPAWQDDAVRSAVAAAPAQALADMAARVPSLGPVVNGWMELAEGMGVYGNAYLRRADIAMVGLGANPPEDAMYPLLVADADGAPLDGGHRYVLHFDAGALPPVDAFWSVTMYDGDGFQVANELDRFAIGDRDDLVPNPDGSLDLHIQHERPAPELVANWLPAPQGPLGITMRLYAPRQEALTGAWAPPPVRRLD